MHPADTKRLEREREIHRATRGPDYSTERDLYRRRMEEYSNRRASQAEQDNWGHEARRNGRDSEL
ncbi:MAG: hypothetical protein AAGG69_06715 [Pseudomonadota bacterium]